MITETMTTESSIESTATLLETALAKNIAASIVKQQATGRFMDELSEDAALELIRANITSSRAADGLVHAAHLASSLVVAQTAEI